MARPAIPPDLVPLLVDVVAEAQRLKTSGLAGKLSALDRRRYELPAVLQGPADGMWFRLWWKDVTALASGVELPGLSDPPPQERITGRRKARGPRKVADEAWLKRQLDGLGETGGA